SAQVGTATLTGKRQRAFGAGGFNKAAPARSNGLGFALHVDVIHQPEIVGALKGDFLQALPPSFFCGWLQSSAQVGTATLTGKRQRAFGAGGFNKAAPARSNGL
ncbi:hypothetical protein C0Q16_29010, partial [Klebsiella pneumoniae]